MSGIEIYWIMIGGVVLFAGGWICGLQDAKNIVRKILAEMKLKP